MKRTLGVCYYPEHWPEAQWAEDAARMAALGPDLGADRRIRLEPDGAGARALTTGTGWTAPSRRWARAGLKVVLGTPTATPPRWMLDRHPDMLAAGPRRQTARLRLAPALLLSRTAATAPNARASSPRWPNAMARTPMSPPGRPTTNMPATTRRCPIPPPRCTPSAIGWRSAISRPQALNRAWGNVFWSMDYASFDEIGLPNLTVTEANPAHVMDFRRFASDEVVSFNRLQTEIIRKHSAAPIAHNYMGADHRVRPFRRRRRSGYRVLGQLPAWASCPTACPPDAEHKRRFVRQGDPDFQAFHHDLYRAVGRGRWWIMEQQPGPVNWAPWNPDPAARHGPALGVGGLCPWCRGGLLFPLASGALCAGTDARGPVAPRQRRRPGL